MRLAGLCALLWLVWISHQICTYGKLDRARHSDCIIVLGAAVHGDKPSPVFEERINHTITLYRSNFATVIIFTGGYGENASHAEAAVGAAYAIRAGVPASAILIETVSRTTRENLVHAKAVMNTARLRSAIIVSDPLHLKRAAKMANDLDLASVTSPTPSSRYRNASVKFKFFLRELYFYHHYLITGN